jgi:hypothetical protein
LALLLHCNLDASDILRRAASNCAPCLRLCLEIVVFPDKSDSNPVWIRVSSAIFRGVAGKAGATLRRKPAEGKRSRTDFERRGQT